MNRPAFLEAHHTNGKTIVEGFLALTPAQQGAVDQWLVWALCYGSMTWQEQALWAAIESEGL